MPQLDFIHYPSQLLWLALSFGILYWMLAWHIIPIIEDVLEKRNAHIDEHLRKAERLQIEAARLQAQHDKTLADARAQAQDILAEQQKILQADHDARVQKMEDDLKKQWQNSEHTIRTAHEKAKDELKERSLPLLKAIVTKATGLSPSDDKLKKSLSELDE